MIVRERLGRLLEDPRGSAASTLFLAVLGLALIVAAESGRGRTAGPFGYLLLQAAGALWLQRYRRIGWARWAAPLMLWLFIVNAALLLLIETGASGPQIVLIAFVLVLLFFSAIAGGLAAVAALLGLGLPIRDRPRPPIGPALGGTVVAMVMASLIAAAEPPPPPPSATPFSVQPVVTPTPAPTPTATPTPAGARTFPLTIVVNGAGSVQLQVGTVCRARCTFPIVEGTIVSPSQSPAAGLIFVGWRGCDAPGACRIRMTGPREIQATFRQPTLRVSFGGKDRGTVRSEPKGIECPPACESGFPKGSRVVLTAAAGSGAVFTGWSLGCTGFSCDLPLQADSEAIASFETAAPGRAASLCGESARSDIQRSGTRQIAVCFNNVGDSSWVRGAPAQKVYLATCCPLGEPSPQRAWNSGWVSDHVYADLPLDNVAPGQNVTVVFAIRAPDNAPIGSVHHFDGILVLASSGAPLQGGTFTVFVTVR